MKYLYVMCGLPASGKSFERDRIVRTFKEVGSSVFVYSTDDELEMLGKIDNLTYNEAFEKNYFRTAQRNCDEALKAALEAGVDVVIWDQTNLLPSKRSRILSKFDCDVFSVCMAFLPPRNAEEQKEWETRQALREANGKTIPKDVMNNMLGQYVPPSFQEGFDDIKYYYVT